MSEFRDKIKKRIIAFECISIIAVVAGIYHVFIGIPGGYKGDDFSDGMGVGVSLGIITALGMLAVVQVIRLRRAIKDEKQLNIHSRCNTVIYRSSNKNILFDKFIIK